MHLFDEICRTFNLNAFSYDEMKLKFFFDTLIYDAKAWLCDQPTCTFDTWKKLATAFFTCYYPESRTYEVRRKIGRFGQRPGENLFKTYIRYRYILKECPRHYYAPWMVLHLFYGWLDSQNKQMVDLSLGGAFMKYSITQAWGFLDKIWLNQETWKLDTGGKGGV